MHPVFITILSVALVYRGPAAGVCDTASTTRSAEMCLEQVSRSKDDTVRRLEAAVRARLDKTASASFDSAFTAWRTYRARECNSVYDFWRQGTIRNTEYMQCVIDLTDERIGHLARTFFPPRGVPRDSIARVFDK